MSKAEEVFIAMSNVWWLRGSYGKFHGHLGGRRGIYFARIRPVDEKFLLESRVIRFNTVIYTAKGLYDSSDEAKSNVHQCLEEVSRG